MKKRILILALLLVIVLASGCVEKGTLQQVVPTGEHGQSAVEAGHIEKGETQNTQGQPLTTGDDGNVLSVINEEIPSGKPTGPFLINMTLSNTPSLNKDVEVTITVGVLTGEFQNSTIGFSIYDRAKEYELPSYLMQPMFQKRWQNITISENETVTVKSIFRLSEQGHFTIGAGAGHKLGANFVTLFLNLTEKSARITDESYELPRPPSPPNRPYIVKLDIQGVPRLNNTVQLTATIASIIDQKNSTFTVILPEGVTLVNGDLNWSGNLTGGIPRDWSAKLDKTPLELRSEGKSLAGEIIRRSNISPTHIVKIVSQIKLVKEGDLCIAVVPFGEPLPPVECSYAVPVIYPETNRRAYSMGGTLHVRVGRDSGTTTEVGFDFRPTTPIETTQPVPKKKLPETPSPTTYPPGVTPPSEFTTSPSSNITPTIPPPPHVPQ